MPPRLRASKESEGTLALLAGCFELLNVLQALYKGSRENEGSRSGVLPREWCSISARGLR